jgi:hypothetical protein
LPARFLQFAAQQQWKVDRSAIKPDELNWDGYDAVADGNVTPLYGISDCI